MIPGIQVSSLKSLLGSEESVKQAFAAMKALGCRTVQLQWIDPRVPIGAIAGALEENQMISVGVQDFYALVQENLSYYVNLNQETGGTWLCVSRIPDRFKSPSGLEAFARELEALRDHLAPLGQKLCFHPVSADFQAVPGMDAVEYLLGRLPWLALCLDLYHLNRNCPDMPGFIRRLGSRVCMVHFKDSRDGRLVPAGQGDTPWEGVVSACLDAGVLYGFAEQETWDRDPYACLGEALQWLGAQLSEAGNLR